MKTNKLFLWLPVLLLVVPVAYILKSIELSYSISSKGIVYPEQEWVLSRSSEGNIINSIRDNRNNSIKQYSITEFQRGDLGSFMMLPGIFDKEFVKKGDTIGIMISQNERRRHLELTGELNRQKKLLSVYSSGDRPDEINIANEKVILARQEFETQERITERNRILFDRSYIPEEEYEISVNELNIKKQNFLIAESQHLAMQSGAKQEQLDYIQATIESLNEQIRHVESLMSDFTIISPIFGRIARKQGANIDYDAIIRVTDTRKFIMLIPIDIYNLPFLSLGQKINFKTPSGRDTYEGTITDIDNSIQMLNGRQKIFLTASLEQPEDDNTFYPNMLVDVSIPSQDVSLKHFISRLINEIYNN